MPQNQVGESSSFVFWVYFLFSKLFCYVRSFAFRIHFKISLSISINKPDERVTYPRSHNSYALESAQSPIVVTDPSSRSDSGPHTDDWRRAPSWHHTASFLTSAKGQECGSQYTAKKTNPVYRHLAPVWPYQHRKDNWRFVWNKSDSHGPIVWRPKLKPWHPRTLSFNNPLAVDKSIQASFCLAFRVCILSSHWKESRAELSYLGLRYHSHSFRSSPLSPPPSHWLVLQSNGCSGHSQAPWAWVYPMAGPTHRAVPLISIPFPNQAQLLFCPYWRASKKYPFKHPAIPTAFWPLYIFFAIKKKKRNNAICSNMDGPRDFHTKRSKSDRERQVSYDITYMWNLIKMIQMSLFTKQKQTNRSQKSNLWLLKAD